MVTPVLNLQTRNSVGKNSMVKERRKGKIPGVVYSRGKDTKAVYLKEKELNQLLSRYGSSIKIALDFEGEKTFAIIKEIQKETMQNKLLHIDFQTLDENEKVRLTMPVHLINRESVESSTQIVEIQLGEIEIQTYPRFLPDKIELDAALLKEKDALTIGDLNIGHHENIEILEDKNRIVASLVYATKQ